MKFGIFYELQSPRPWEIDTDLNLYQNALSQVELADKLGYHYAWEVEHHFLEEYSHSPQPEVFLAAASHDLRQPVHALNLFVTQLQQARDDAQHEKINDRIHLCSVALHRWLLRCILAPGLCGCSSCSVQRTAQTRRALQR